LNFSLTLTYGPEIDSDSNTNECQVRRAHEHTTFMSLLS
jgi:hypothetical protein